MSQVRREAERTDALRSFVLVHSVGGGTGSGVGSALLHHVRDFYPSAWLLPVAVGAFARGDTPLQVQACLWLCIRAYVRIVILVAV